MLNKILTGCDFLDIDGGLYQHRAYVITSEDNTAKTLISSQFLMKGIEKGEVALLVTTKNVHNYLIEVHHNLGFDFSPHLHDGTLNIMQYNGDQERSVNQLSRYILEMDTFIKSKGIDRMVIDFVPLLGAADKRIMRKSVKSFIQFLETAKVTAVLLLDTPTTPFAHNLKKLLLNEITGACNIEKEYSEERKDFYYKMEIEKMIGYVSPYPHWNFEISKSYGIKEIKTINQIFYSAMRKK